MRCCCCWCCECRNELSEVQFRLFKLSDAKRCAAATTTAYLQASNSVASQGAGLSTSNSLRLIKPSPPDTSISSSSPTPRSINGRPSSCFSSSPRITRPKPTIS